MLHAITFILLTGLFVRADGWGGIKAINVWLCSPLFALLVLLYSGDAFVSLAAGLSFLLWRLPAFHGWEDWENMFWRGVWPTFIGFTALSYIVHGEATYGLLCVPFGVVYASIYSYGYKYLPQNILSLDRHVWIEHASGWVFGLCIVIIGVLK